MIDQSRLGRTSADRTRSPTTDTEERLRDLLAVHHDRRRRGYKRRVVLAPAQLGKADVSAGTEQRQPNLVDKLVSLEHRLKRRTCLKEIRRRKRCSKRRFEEVWRGNEPMPTSARDADARVEHGAQQTPFRRGVGVRDAAAERAPHPDRQMPDVPPGDPQQAAQRVGRHAELEPPVRHARTDR